MDAIEQLRQDVTEICREIGEIKATLDSIIERLDKMEKKYNGANERSIRSEEKIDELFRKIEEIEKDRMLKFHFRAAIAGGLSGSVAGFILGVMAKLFG